jgi:hypothetical protein
MFSTLLRFCYVSFVLPKDEINHLSSNTESSAFVTGRTGVVSSSSSSIVLTSADEILSVPI